MVSYQMTSPSTLAVIIPAYNAEATLESCLVAIAASKRKPTEVIMFNDGSTDTTVEIAKRHGVKIVTNDKRAQGPAIGRNLATQETDADILVFIDADVDVHPNSIGLLESAILKEPDVAAAFGSYDDAPLSNRIAALYANLRHHYHHQTSARDASTFWSGFGAIRRSDFVNINGFDAAYAEPSIEDIDLGTRLRNADRRILLVPKAMAKHCKDWGLVQLWRTDVFNRALPWSRLIVSRVTDGADLNTSLREKVIAIAAHCIWLFGALSFFAPLISIAFFGAVIFFLAANWKFFILLARRGGSRLLIAGVILHWLYYIYSSLAFAFIKLTHRIMVEAH
ncbi:MAG: glycosyltransferase family 2 protein [Marinicaulis sp.]|nr:glycosyltransferase family 2 protein [Marinicaulis sp.]